MDMSGGYGAYDPSITIPAFFARVFLSLATSLSFLSVVAGVAATLNEKMYKRRGMVTHLSLAAGTTTGVLHVPLPREL